MARKHGKGLRQTKMNRKELLSESQRQFLKGILIGLFIIFAVLTLIGFVIPDPAGDESVEERTLPEPEKYQAKDVSEVISLNSNVSSTIPEIVSSVLGMDGFLGTMISVIVFIVIPGTVLMWIIGIVGHRGV